MYARRHVSKSAGFVLALSIIVPAASAADPDEIFRDGFATFTLTINNYLSWCSVRENGDVSYSPASSFPDGTIVSLVASPVAPFYWGYFSGADGSTIDIGADHSTTVTMTSDRTVLVCCPVSPAGTCP